MNWMDNQYGTVSVGNSSCRKMDRMVFDITILSNGQNLNHEAMPRQYNCQQPVYLHTSG